MTSNNGEKLKQLETWTQACHMAPTFRGFLTQFVYNFDEEWQESN